MMNLSSTFIAGIWALFAIGKAAAGGMPHRNPYTVYDIIRNSPDHDFLQAALRLTALDAVLDDPTEEFTVFAPTDDAFKALLSSLGAPRLSEVDRDTLTDILLYHVVGEKLCTDDLYTGPLETLEGSNVMINIKRSGAIFVNDAFVRPADLTADNGVVHVIDTVLIPPEPVQPPVYEPVPEPYYPANPDPYYQPVDPQPYYPPVVYEPNIIEIVEDDSRFDILYHCLGVAGLRMAVRDSEDITVFAPNDWAFRNLFRELGVQNCRDIPTNRLEEILLYHVVGEVIYSEDLSVGDQFETLQGAFVRIDTNNYGRNVYVNDAQIIDTDIEASNGIIHAIKKVLIPPVTKPIGGGYYGY